MKYLILIPARKNSKRIKNKNLRKFKGYSLIDIALKESLKIKVKKKIVVSSDSNKILEKSKLEKYKQIKFLKRPAFLSEDNSSIESLILYLLEKELRVCNFENILILQPTSPSRNHIHINRCIKKYERNKLDSIFSVYKDNIFLWSKSLRSITYNYKKRENTQYMKNYFIENGAIFIFKTSKFLKLKNKRRIFGKFDFFEMPKKDSIDIDYEEDLK